MSPPVAAVPTPARARLGSPRERLRRLGLLLGLGLAPALVGLDTRPAAAQGLPEGTVKGPDRRGPTLKVDAAVRAMAAEAELRAHLAALRRAPPGAGPRPNASVAGARRAMQILEAIIDAAHHGANLEDGAVRPTALALRSLLGRWRTEPEGLLTLVDDVWWFRPAVYDTLADALGRQGDRRGALVARSAAVSAGAPTPARLEAWADALRAAGHAAEAALIEARLPAPPSPPLSPPAPARPAAAASGAASTP